MAHIPRTNVFSNNKHETGEMRQTRQAIVAPAADVTSGSVMQTELS